MLFVRSRSGRQLFEKKGEEESLLFSEFLLAAHYGKSTMDLHCHHGLFHAKVHSARLGDNYRRRMNWHE
jgi:hypothetical protein